MNASGECFVHTRQQYSSNKDLRALRGLTNGGNFYKANLGRGRGEISPDELRQIGEDNCGFELQQ